MLMLRTDTGRTSGSSCICIPLLSITTTPTTCTCVCMRVCVWAAVVGGETDDCVGVGSSQHHHHQHGNSLLLFPPHPQHHHLHPPKTERRGEYLPYTRGGGKSPRLHVFALFFVFATGTLDCTQQLTFFLTSREGGGVCRS